MACYQMLSVDVICCHVICRWRNINATPPTTQHKSAGTPRLRLLRLLHTAAASAAAPERHATPPERPPSAGRP